MKPISRLMSAGARKAWLWNNGDRFAEPAATDRPRLLVDVSAIIRSDAQTGIQRVVRAVWSELLRRNGQGFALQPVFARNRRGYCYAPIDFLAGTHSCSVAEAVRVRPGDKFLGLDLSAHLLPHYRPQLNAWKASGATIHLVVYDLLPLLRPEWFSAATAANFRKWLKLVVNDADQAICISDQVARDLKTSVAAAGRPGPAVVRMQMGADIAGSIPSAGVSERVSRTVEKLRFRSAILMVGTVEPRKGYDAALPAFEHLWRTRPADAPDLVIVGKPGWKTAALQARLRLHPEREVRLHWLTDVSDEALCSLYEACAGVFIASRGEGFGLPLIEAAQFGRHVLARDLPVFREQRLANVFFFQDDAPPALAQQLIELAGVGKSRSAPAVNLVTWADCVDGLLREMGQAHEQYGETESPLRKAS